MLLFCPTTAPSDKELAHEDLSLGPKSLKNESAFVIKYNICDKCDTSSICCGHAVRLKGLEKK